MDQRIRERLLHTCAWCYQEIPPDQEAFGFGAKASSGIDLSDKEGEFVSLALALSKKTVVALVATQSSAAKIQGYDLAFLTCSLACAKDLKEALEFERDVLGDNL